MIARYVTNFSRQSNDMQMPSGGTSGLLLT